ncbi:hypothetical protein LQW54_004841 [Pestalotiopsis sp. IQ-011]
MPDTEEHSTSSRSSKHSKSRQRVHKPPAALEVPDINEDASERKRILNVLAQRRYRQRKRQKKLEESEGNESETREDSLGYEGHAQETSQASSPYTQATRGSSIETSSLQAPSHFEEASMTEFDMPTDWNTYSLSPANSEYLLAPGDDPAQDPYIPYDTSDYMPAVSGVATQSYNIDPNLYMDMSYQCEDDYHSSSRASAAGEEAAQPYAFPNSYPMTLSELKVLQAFVRLATNLNCDVLWHALAAPLFGDGSAMPDVSAAGFPAGLVQMPGSSFLVIDFSPWSSTRHRLVGLAPLPDGLKPAFSVDSGLAINLLYGTTGNTREPRIWSNTPHDMFMHVYQLFAAEMQAFYRCQSVSQSSSWKSMSDEEDV